MKTWVAAAVIGHSGGGWHLQFTARAERLSIESNDAQASLVIASLKPRAAIEYSSVIYCVLFPTAMVCVPPAAARGQGHYQEISAGPLIGISRLCKHEDLCS